MRRFVLLTLLAALLCQGPAKKGTVELPVLMYHHISKDASRSCDYVVTPELLEGDLAWLSERGCTAVSAQELIDYCAGRGTLPERPVLITFDDGQLSVLEYALPLLEKYDMCAVAAVVGSLCDREAGLSWRSPEYSYMDWDEVAQLSASGVFEIAAHSQAMHEEAYPRRGCLPKPGEGEADYRRALSEDLEAVERSIEAASGARPTAFAWPYGFHCEAGRELLAERGYRLALTCEERVNTLTGRPEELMELARFNRPASEPRGSGVARLGIAA